MLDKLEKIQENAQEQISSCQSEEDLQLLKAHIMGRKGSLTALLKEVPTLPIELRPEAGKRANEIKNHLAGLIEKRQEELLTLASAVPQYTDLTLPGIRPPQGGLHPITQMCYDLNDAFRSLGFEIFSEDEITSELYGFDNLNFTPDHPARESMDTYWIEGHDKGTGAERLCLRPHLTGASVRYMQSHSAPYRFVYPGRVYRNENTDARHERAFYQYEALVVDEKFAFSSGKIMVKAILDKVFGRDVEFACA
jgi:phenylalanyl-tRNA synthetase, alpha subunit (EC 6.1.1.20)